MQHHKTAWSKHASLPSDRIPVKSKPQPQPKIKYGVPPAEPPKSKAVRDLEALLSAVRNESNSILPDPKGGCFCQARTHPSSPYTPICMRCALPLCSLNPPSHACPHCTSSLIPSSAQRAKLSTNLETQLSDTLAREEAERIQIQADARKAAGAFPSLLSSAPQPQTHSQVPRGPSMTLHHPQAHKVLSLNSKTKRAVLTTTTSHPSPPASNTPSRPASPPVVRVPPPLGVDLLHVKERVRPERPWENLILRRDGEDVSYVPSPDANKGRKKDKTKVEIDGRGKNKGKDKEN